MEIDTSHGAALFAANRADEATQAAEAGEQFEGYLIEMMVKEMRKTVPDGIFSSSAMEMFSGLFDQHLSNAIAEGGGLGISEMLQGSIGVPADPSTRSMTLLNGARRYAAQAAHHGHDHGHMPIEGRVTSRFGRRSDPFNNTTRMHRGLDIAARQGTPIRPIRPGKVVFSGSRGGLGNAVIIDHGEGIRSVYGHCHELNVRAGDTVGAGTVIATVGSTGRSTGPHLHLEVHQNGEAVNPEPFVGMQ